MFPDARNDAGKGKGKGGSKAPKASKAPTASKAPKASKAPTVSKAPKAACSGKGKGSSRSGTKVSMFDVCVVLTETVVQNSTTLTYFPYRICNPTSNT